MKKWAYRSQRVNTLIAIRVLSCLPSGRHVLPRISSVPLKIRKRDVVCSFIEVRSSIIFNKTCDYIWYTSLEIVLIFYASDMQQIQPRTSCAHVANSACSHPSYQYRRFVPNAVTHLVHLYGTSLLQNIIYLPSAMCTEYVHDHYNIFDANNNILPFLSWT